MEHSTPIPNFGYIWTLSSAILFFYINKVLLKYTPTKTQLNNHQKWKWKNISSSCIHSLITGTWSIICLLKTPIKSREILTFYTRSAHQLISLSTGYFLYDLFDIFYNNRGKSGFELIFHHILVLLCFGIAITQRYYIGFAMISLLVEINSVFLHIRDLLLLYQYKKNDSIYKLNSFINLVTFIVFRFITLTWMLYYLFYYQEEFSKNVLVIGIISLPIILIMNIVLFYRIIYSDFITKSLTNE